MAYYASSRPGVLPRGLARLGGRRTTRRSATIPTGPWSRASRSPAGRWGTACRSRSGSRSACAHRGSARGSSYSSATQSSTRAATTRRSSSRPRCRLEASPWWSSTTASASYAVPGSDRAAVRREGWRGRGRRRSRPRALHRALTRRPQPGGPPRPGRGRRPRRGEVRHEPGPAASTFAATAADLVEEDLSVALVYAEISGSTSARSRARHPDRVVNVGHPRAAAGQRRCRPGAHRDAARSCTPSPRSSSSGPSSRSSSASTTRTSGECWWARAVLRRRPGRGPHPPGTRRRRADGHPARRGRSTCPGHADEVEAALRRAVAGDGRDYVRVVAQQNDAALPGAPWPLPRRTPGSGPPPWWRWGRCSTPVLAATEGPRRGGALREHGPALRRGGRCARSPWVRRRWCSSSRTWRVPRPGCVADALVDRAAPAALARRRPRGAAPLRHTRASTRPRTGWTPPACARRSAVSSQAGAGAA